MAAAEEVLTGIDTARTVNDTNASAVVSAGAGVEDTMAQTDAAKAKADELADQLAGMGITDRAGVAGQVSAKLAEAHQAAASVKSQLETAQTGLGQVKSLFDEAYTLAQALGGSLRAPAPGTRLRPLAPPGSTSPGAVATPLDVPGRNGPRIQYQTGDQVTAPDGGPDDYHAELRGENDDRKSRLQRFSRRAVAVADDLSSAGKDIGKSGASVISDFDPHSYGQETVQASREAPTISPAHHDTPQVTDMIGTTVILSALVVEAVSRRIRKKDDDR